MQTENKSGLENLEKTLKSAEKTINRIYMFTKLLIAILNFLKYVVIWTSVSFFIYMCVLPILFIWTGDYIHLKILGTIIFGILALTFFGWGIFKTIECFKFSKENKKSNEERLDESLKKSSESWTDVLKRQEAIISNTTDTTLQMVHLKNIISNLLNNTHDKKI